MQTSLVYWVKAAYRDAGLAKGMAMDKNPASLILVALRALTRRWQLSFNELADSLAQQFALRVRANADAALVGHLRSNGFSVKFTMSPEMRTAYEAVIGENVALIKSIASEHLSDVEGLVMRSVSRGRDLGTLTAALQKRYGVTKRRAALISRDQNNKATSVLQSVRQQKMGITEGLWRHSHAGKVPRPSHVKADGKRFTLAEGMYLDGEWVMPGQLINCLPGDAQIEFAAGCKKLWRRSYAGDLTELVTESGETLKATPNHPILTRRGWIPICQVNPGEYVFSVSDQVVDRVKDNINDRDACISDVFDLTSFYIGSHSSKVSGLEFHGDVVDEKVDTIDIAGFLPDDFGAERAQAICESFLPSAYVILIEGGFGVDSTHAATFNRLFRAPESVIRGLCACLSLLRGHPAHADDICSRLSARLDSCQREASANHVSADAERLSQSKFAFSRFIPGNDLLVGQLISLVSAASAWWCGNPASAEFLGKAVGTHADVPGCFSKSGTINHHVCRVVDKRSRDFSGHVYNLETAANWYAVSGLVYHNCRCGWKAVIPGLE